MKTMNFLSLLFAVLFLPAQVFAQLNTVPEVAPDAVAGLLAKDALFVDVREVNEVEALAYDLPGVMNLPLSELPERLAEIPRNRSIVLACRSGKRSLKAAALLSENNYTQLFNLTGGIIAWEAADLPVLKQLRTTDATPAGKACCSSTAAKGKGAAGKSCCADKAKTASAKGSCGEAGKGKGKGKSCCAGGGR